MGKQEIKYIDLLELKDEWFKYFTEEESLKAVKDWGGNLQHVINQTEEICIEAYKEDINSIAYIRIDIKDEELRKKREKRFRYFTDEESLEAIRKNGFVLMFVHDQTEQICLEAYKQNLRSFVYIRDSLEEYSESFLTN